MGLRTILKTAGHWLKGSIVKVDSEIQFDTTTNPEIDSTGGNFVWHTQTSDALSWKLHDPGVIPTEDILIADTAAKTFTLHTNYTANGFGSGGGGGWTRVTENTGTRVAAANEFILINAATCAITLPAPVDSVTIAVKAIVVPTSIQIITSGAGINIDGIGYSSTGLFLTAQWEQISLISDGTNWFIY